MTTDPGSRPAPGSSRCSHVPACPAADSAERYSAQVMMRHEAQGWAMLCNGILVFGSDQMRAARPLYSLPSPTVRRAGKATRIVADKTARTLRAG